MPDGPWVLVVGCHRSGTSAVTGALVALGLQGVAPHDRIEPSSSNPEHWESLALTLHDEDLLVRGGGTWDAPPPAAAEPLGVVGPGQPGDPAAAVAAAYPVPGPLVWKDPRVCLLLPYWRGLLPAPLAAVFVWREPLGAARSLHTRDDMPLLDGLVLWERYNRSAVTGLQGVDTFVVSYDDVLDDPAGTLGTIAAWLAGLDQFAPYADGWDVAAAAGAIDPGLHHETATGDDRADLLPSYRGLAAWLAAAAGPHAPLDSTPPAADSPWAEALLETRRHGARYRRLAEGRGIELRKQAAEHAQVVATLEALVRSREARLHVMTSDLEGERMRYEGVKAELDRVLASSSWRMTAPLRAALAKLSGPGR